MRHSLRYADWSWREFAAAVGCIASGRVKRGENPGRLAVRLRALYAPSTVYPVNLGRTAISIALEIFRASAPARTEVVVPSYICASVVETIQAAGLTAVPAAVGPDLNLTAAALDAVLGPATLAVVAPHMFGCPAEIAAIEAACRSAGVFLVDDAAQVVDERLNGRLLGTFGDVGVISFAQSKAVVTGVGGSGGVLLVNNPQLDAAARGAWSRLGLPQGRAGALAHFVWDLLWARYTGHTGYYLRRLRDALGHRNAPTLAPARISNLDAAIALVQLERLPRIRERKIAASEAYHTALACIPAIGFPQFAPGRYLSRIMLSLPVGTDLPALRTELKRRGVETRLGYQAPARPDQPDDAMLPGARRLLGLPFGGEMTPACIEEICATLKAALAAVQPQPFCEQQNELRQTAH